MHVSVHLPQCRPTSYGSMQKKADELKQVSKVSLIDLLHILSVYSYPEATRLVIGYYLLVCRMQKFNIVMLGTYVLHIRCI